MNDAKHTPGPWTYTNRDGIAEVHGDAGDILLWEDAEGGEEAHANARLIAAAPNLLDALTAIRARISGEWDNPALLKFGPLSDMTTDIQIIARTAIRKAKAEGK